MMIYISTSYMAKTVTTNKSINQRQPCRGIYCVCRSQPPTITDAAEVRNDLQFKTKNMGFKGALPRFDAIFLFFLSAFFIFPLLFDF